MTILQAGMAKSGNFWLYRIIQSVIRHAGLETKSFIKQHPIYPLARSWKLPTAEHADINALEINQFQCLSVIWPIFREPVEDIDNYIASCSHVWTHSPMSKYAQTILPKFDKVVYILRDPRDTAVSMSHFVFTPYFMKHGPHGYSDPEHYLADRLEGLIRTWKHHVGGYLQLRKQLGIHVVFYERILQSFESEFAEMLKYLGVALGQDAITAIAEDVGLETMKDRYPDQVRKGQAGQWCDALTDKQNRRAIEIAGPLMKRLNYPFDRESVGRHLPGLPARQQSGNNSAPD